MGHLMHEHAPVSVFETLNVSTARGSFRRQQCESTARESIRTDDDVLAVSEAKRSIVSAFRRIAGRNEETVCV